MKKPLFLALILFGCGPVPPPPPAPPDPILDNIEACTDASKNIDKVCPKLSTTPAGKPFDQFCREKMEQGVPMNPTCIIKASSCDGANACIGSY